ncbi:MAG: hypothetical protein OHK0039_04470 [Bacteroidia bacterium]
MPIARLHLAFVPLRRVRLMLLALVWLVPVRLAAQDRVHVETEVALYPHKTAQLFKYTLLLPRNIPGRQTVLDVSFSQTPERVFEEGDNRYAVFRFVRLARPETLRISFDLLVDPVAPPVADGPPSDALLAPEPYLESQDPAIRQAAAALRAATPAATAQRIYQFVRDTLHYDAAQLGARGAAEALRSGTGDCTEYADLMVALCRAAAIPSRTASGLVVGLAGDNPNHHWAEVWLPGQGWTTFDPTLDNRRTDRSRPEIHYVLLSTLRLDPHCQGGNNYWQAWGQVEVMHRYKTRLLRED